MALGDSRLTLIHFRLAEVYARQGKYPQAITEYDAAFLHAENLESAYPELADIRALTADPQRIVQAYQDLVEKIRANPDINLNEEGEDDLVMAMAADTEREFHG